MDGTLQTLSLMKCVRCNPALDCIAYREEGSRTFEIPLQCKRAHTQLHTPRGPLEGKVKQEQTTPQQFAVKTDAWRKPMQSRSLYCDRLKHGRDHLLSSAQVSRIIRSCPRVELFLPSSKLCLRIKESFMGLLYGFGIHFYFSM